MNKVLKKIYKFVILFLIMFLFVSYAAILSNNDGSAFITKSEFDALKNSFNKQIDDYNSNIVGKIDEAIAQYLNGVALELSIEEELYFPVNSTTSSKYRVYSVEPNKNGIKNQFFNSIQLSLTCMAHQGTNTAWKPWATDSGYVNDFAFYSVSLSNLTNSNFYTPKMEGYVFDSANATVITNFYRDNRINIMGSLSITSNLHDCNEADILKVAPEGIFDGSSVVLNEAIKLGSGCVPIEGLYSSNDGSTTTYLDRAAIDINDYWPKKIGEIETSGTATSWKTISGAGTYPALYLNDSWLITESKLEEDKNLYLYNRCDAKIYAHSNMELNVERFSDDSSLDGIDAINSNLIWDNCINPTYTIMYGTALSAGVASGPGYVGADLRKGFFWLFPKIRLKNTQVAKPSGQNWNNLNQFKNGYLGYKGVTGMVYPNYYGGLPLFTVDVNNASEVTGKIKIKPTTTSYTGNMRVWIKDGEFINNDDISTWGTEDKNKLMKLSVISGGGTYNNTLKCLEIPPNTDINFKIESPKRGSTYFLRFAEANKKYGGEITYLDNFVIAIEN